MSANTLQYIFKLQDLVSDKLKKIGIEGDKQAKIMAKAERSISSFKRVTSTAFNFIAPMAIAAAGIYKLTSFINGSTKAYEIQSLAEKKLEVIMRQRMKATDDQIESIKKLASAQQKIGVIGDEVSLSGAQQLSTFLNQKKSLDSLLPAMNNLLAQQKGLNATSEDATNIGNLMGKVMQGQIGALTRVGITFTAAEEKVLKYGNEQQRAATLAKVIENNVGKANEAIAQTPEGRLKQASNRMGDIQERVGGLVVKIKAAFLPLLDKFASKFEELVGYLEENKDKIMAAVDKVGAFISKVGGVVWRVMSGIISGISWWWNKLKEGEPIITLITTVIGALVGSIIAYNVITKIATAITIAWKVAMMAFKLVASMNPVSLIIIAIITLISLITVCIKNFENWGSAILMLMGPIGGIINAIMIFKKHWDSITKAFKEGGMIAGLKRIGAVLLDTLLYPMQQLLELVAKIPGMGKLAQGGADMIKNIRVKLNLTDPQDKIAKTTTTKSSKITPAGVPGVISPNGTTNGESKTKAITEGVASGGSRNTSINITIGKMGVDKMEFKGSLSENAKEIESKFTELLMRVLYSAQSVG